MTYRSWRSHVVRPSRAELTWPSCPDLEGLGLTLTILHRNTNRILTQWDFHRVQEHPKRSSDEEVMTYQSWRSHVIRPSRAELAWPSCPDLEELSLTPTILHRHKNRILTQWNFHRVKNTPNGVRTKKL